tara:strand:- start:1087 stop:2523 length:1437 start_codon:yes stop_codon:yes gene_type:complete
MTATTLLRSEMTKVGTTWYGGDVPVVGALRAFPNAEGLAALTRGAAGYSGVKSVAFVDNTNDSGSGSLRAAVEGAGKEGTFVIFRTSGIINLTTSLNITSDCITIAAQTSPSGIVIAGANVRLTNTSNIIIRHLRSRLGAHSTVSDEESEALSVWGGDNIMIDKSSFSWGKDETVGVTSYSDPFTRITFSRCIISEGLTDEAPESNHGYGLLANGNYNTGNSIDIHNTVFVSQQARSPQLSNNIKANLVNNVSFNHDGSLTPDLEVYSYQGAPIGVMNVNSIGNFTKAGIESNTGVDWGGAKGTAREMIAFNSGTPYPFLYMLDNYGEQRQTDAQSEWQISSDYAGTLLSTGWQANTPFVTTDGVAITPRAVDESNYIVVRNAVVTDAGATIPVTDDVDARIKAEYLAGTGAFKATSSYPSDYGTFGSDSYPTDTDSDGIPDAYWTYKSTTAQTWSDTAPSGYLWIEEYANDVAEGNF